MKPRLTWKFLLGYLALGVIVFCLIAVGGSHLFMKTACQGQALDLYTAARRIAAHQEEIYQSGNQAYDPVTLSTVADLTNTRILILNTEKKVVFDTNAESELLAKTLPDFDPADSRNYYRTGNFYGAFQNEMLSVQAPITSKFTAYGYVTLHQSMSVVREKADFMLRGAYLLGLMIYLASLGILVILQVFVIRPLAKITRGAGEFASGNWKHKIDVRQQDEMGYLAASLNLMAQELQTSEDYQKKFIANVSHDFRSPLTSIKGYLQAMADGVIPPESQEKYMNIIIGETERLTNLTQSMLSLNSLDDKRLNLEKSSFDMIALVRGVCEMFEGSCSRKGITFDLMFSNPKIYVYADLGRIQQVMYNLIDNAIKFSYEDSSIRVQVYEQADKVSISVKDYGVGIPKDSIKQIFTRFYKTDISRGRDKKGTGLGLAIVKEILQAHQENIDVISTEGSGSEFIFRLPKGEYKSSEAER